MRKTTMWSFVVGAIAAAGLGWLASVPVVAHHAFGAECDPNRPVVLRGPVVRVEWVNPPTWIHVEVAGEDGDAQVRMVEGGTPQDTASAWPDEGHDPDWCGRCGRWISKQGPQRPGERTRRHF